MSVMIEALPDSARLRVSGDVETVLSVPFEDDDRFLVGLSDGTLLVGCYDDGLRCTFGLAREGAGLVRFGDGRARVDFSISWATVSAYDANVVAGRKPAGLPLFPDDDLGDAIPW